MPEGPLFFSLFRRSRCPRFRSRLSSYVIFPVCLSTPPSPVLLAYPFLTHSGWASSLFLVLPTVGTGCPLRLLSPRSSLHTILDPLHDLSLYFLFRFGDAFFVMLVVTYPPSRGASRHLYRGFSSLSGKISFDFPHPR